MLPSSPIRGRLPEKRTCHPLAPSYAVTSAPLAPTTATAQPHCEKDGHGTPSPEPPPRFAGGVAGRESRGAVPVPVRPRRAARGYRARAAGPGAAPDHRGPHGARRPRRAPDDALHRDGDRSARPREGLMGGAPGCGGRVRDPLRAGVPDGGRLRRHHARSPLRRHRGGHHLARHEVANPGRPADPRHARRARADGGRPDLGHPRARRLRCDHGRGRRRHVGPGQPRGGDAEGAALLRRHRDRRLQGLPVARTPDDGGGAHEQDVPLHAGPAPRRLLRPAGRARRPARDPGRFRGGALHSRRGPRTHARQRPDGLRAGGIAGAARTDLLRDGGLRGLVPRLRGLGSLAAPGHRGRLGGRQDPRYRAVLPPHGARLAGGADRRHGDERTRCGGDHRGRDRAPAGPDLSGDFLDPGFHGHLHHGHRACPPEVGDRLAARPRRAGADGRRATRDRHRGRRPFGAAVGQAPRARAPRRPHRQQPGPLPHRRRGRAPRALRRRAPGAGPERGGCGRGRLVGRAHHEPGGERTRRADGERDVRGARGLRGAGHPLGARAGRYAQAPACVGALRRAPCPRGVGAPRSARRLQRLRGGGGAGEHRGTVPRSRVRGRPLPAVAGEARARPGTRTRRCPPWRRPCSRPSP
jgi:hypothetical protein